MTLWQFRRPQTTTRDPLLEKARNGDADAIRALLTPHETLVFRLCLALLGNPADAEDAAQETLLQAIRALPRFRGEAQVSTWLVRIARNVCHKRRPRVTLPLDDATISTASPEAAALDRAALQAALTCLTPLQRTCLLLQAVEGWSMAEIAQSLNINEKKVENELYRARKALARWEQEEGTHGARD